MDPNRSLKKCFKSKCLIRFTYVCEVSVLLDGVDLGSLVLIAQRDIAMFKIMVFQAVRSLAGGLGALGTVASQELA